jgi:hypothetical protein
LREQILTDTDTTSTNWTGGTKFRRKNDPRPPREARNAEINRLVIGAGRPRSGLDRFKDRYGSFAK